MVFTKIDFTSMEAISTKLGFTSLLDALLLSKKNPIILLSGGELCSQWCSMWSTDGVTMVSYGANRSVTVYEKSPMNKLS